MTRAGVTATTSGALLVVALLLPWWGLPPGLADPPSDASPEIEFMAEAFEQDPDGIEEDAFAFFEIRDVIWLVTGVVGFAFGLILLVGAKAQPALSAVVAALGVLSSVLIASVLISPPDLLDLGAERTGQPRIAGDLPFGRESGAYVALASAIGLVSAAFLALRRKGIEFSP